MIPLGEARRHVLDRVPRPEAALVSVDEALGLVLAEDVVAGESVPPFDNTAMDGFAVVAADTSDAPVELEIVETIAAGHAPTVEVRPGQASRIFTGAPMPVGADAVVMVEKTEVVDDDRVRVDIEVPVGHHLRPAGDDLGIGQVVFAAGAVLTAGHLGVLCSLGIEDVPVYPRLRVGVVSTGDELVEGPTPLEPGQIRDSNRRMLLTLAAQAGCEAVDLGIVADTRDAITTAIRRGAGDCDVVLTSGGVSMGDIDLVRVILDELGDMRWMQIAIKPAKPFAFGLVEGTPVFGFPGNPVSSMVSFELLGRPALRQAMGHATLDRPIVTAVADEALGRRADGKTHFARVVAGFGADGRIHVRSAGGQGSHQLAAMANANALALLPDGDGVEAGGVVEAMLLGELDGPGSLPVDQRE
ncbi:MAG: gephyrin-like molybdotransferase Glp [Acidimicrobiales bacterium]|nr:gephyrin-like molybdotransferase Glp [Acidimicrobiales bacterium]